MKFLDLRVICVSVTITLFKTIRHIRCENDEEKRTQKWPLRDPPINFQKHWLYVTQYHQLRPAVQITTDKLDSFWTVSLWDLNPKWLNFWHKAERGWGCQMLCCNLVILGQMFLPCLAKDLERRGCTVSFTKTWLQFGSQVVSSEIVNNLSVNKLFKYLRKHW